MIDYNKNLMEAIAEHKAEIRHKKSHSNQAEQTPVETPKVVTDVKTFRDTPYAYADTMFDGFVKSHNHDPNFRVDTMHREVNCGVEITITYRHTSGMA